MVSARLAAALSEQAGYRDLPLVDLRQHEAAQPGSEVAHHLSGHGCREGVPVRGEPALTADAHHMRAQHQILNQESRIALEPRAGQQQRGSKPALLVDGQIGALGTTPRPAALA